MMASPTRLGLQAVIATSITLYASYFFSLGHGFWATITVLFLLSNTWAEGFEKGLKRLLMTMLGCFVGWILLMLTPNYYYTHVLFILALTFLSCYFLPASYSSAIFFTTVLVVLMLDMLGQKGQDIFIDRILQTAIGAFVVVIVCRFIFPVSSSVQLKESIQEIFFLLDKYWQYKLKTLKENEKYSPPINEHIYITMVEKLTKAKALNRQTDYERYLTGKLKKQKDLGQELKLLTIIAHSIYSIVGIDKNIEKRLSKEDRIHTLSIIERHVLPRWQHLESFYKKQDNKSDQNICPPLLPLTDFLAFYEKKGYQLKHPVLLSGLYYYLKKLLKALDSLIELKR